MENEFKREARKQYLHFFRFWFVILGVLAVAAAVTGVARHMAGPEGARRNTQAPAERVYDYADVLTDAQEDELRELIAQKEAMIGCDLVLVTMRQPVAGSEAKEAYGYRFTDWERNMQDIADDFYDNHFYGYDAPYGDGALILDNWYEDQEGTHLSTSGKIFDRFGDREIDRALSCVDEYIDSDPCRAYSASIIYIAEEMSRKDGLGGVFLMLMLIVPIVAAGVFTGTHLRGKEGKNTTTATTYIEGGKPVMNVQRDDFVRKHVSQRRIETSSSSSGGSGGGRGGAHVSSGGHSHGGGSHRR